MQLDLTNCDREPIHIPGSIQPHGYLFAVNDRGTVVQASSNAAQALGKDLSQIIDFPLESVLGFTLLKPAAEIRFLDQDFDVSIRDAGTLKAVELEPKLGPSAESVADCLRGFHSQRVIRDLADKAVQVVRDLCGFDRVMVYRFLADDTGVVIAEQASDQLEPYLGLHYPASDIPRQARELYLRNWTRLVADVQYEPCPMMASPSAAQPLDMSHCALRSVSPIHVQYLKNMGVRSSMSISLIVGGRLWGLIACHHMTPWYGSKQLREACELIGELASIQLGALEDRHDAQMLRQGQDVLRMIASHMDQQPDLAEGLLLCESELLDLVKATGAAIVRDGKCHLLGATPSTTEVMRLTRWISSHTETDTYKTDRLAEEVPEAKRYASVASGLLAITQSKAGEDFVIWFRPEVIETITWAGNPEKPVAGNNELRPRSSFELWREEVRHRSRPWLAVEETLAHQMRVAILESDLRSMHLRLESRVASRTAELQKAVDELNGFTYSVSHDLRTPLRAMVGNSRILIEEYGDQLGPGIKSGLRRIESSALRMANLVDDLLSYARLGRQELSKAPINLTGIAYACAERLESQGWPCQSLEIHVQEGMLAFGDPDQIDMLFTILIENGCKYRHEGQLPRVWITSEMHNGVAVYEVRNEGIGFDNIYADRLFRPFERLHRNEDYPGTGIGLANAKRIVERHQGAIWAEGSPDEGASFYFTL